MSKFNDLLHLRFKQKSSDKEKMAALVERSNNGELSSFSGIFRVAKLSEREKDALEAILTKYKGENSENFATDLQQLTTITSEVKAITNQAVILHGERIKRAQEILKAYKEGAFTAWLFATYGNRQTPYNFLQYYEFYTLLPQVLHPKLDQMPRQVIYNLASRNGALEKKEEIVRSYRGETKEELLKKIRSEFPLPEEDRRLPDYAKSALQHLKRAKEMLKEGRGRFKEAEKKELFSLVEQIQTLLEG